VKTTEKNGGEDVVEATKVAKAKKRKATAEAEVSKAEPTKKQKTAGKAVGSKRGEKVAETKENAISGRAVRKAVKAKATTQASGTDETNSEKVVH